MSGLDGTDCREDEEDRREDQGTEGARGRNGHGAATANDAGNWTFDGPGGRSFRARHSAVQVWPRLRGLAGARATPAFLRRQGASRPDIKSGAERHPAAPDHRGNVEAELARSPINRGGLVARKDVDTQAENVGRDRAGEQDGATDLGDADK